ncbi:MAG: hypothetical protein AAF626_18085 [Pseudomonadota bacterium]
MIPRYLFRRQSMPGLPGRGPEHGLGRGSGRAFVESFQHDNVALARTRSVRRSLPWVHFAAFLYLAMVLRVVSMAEMGPGSYAARVVDMRAGSAVERITAVIMQPDPISQGLAVNVRRGLRALSGG